MAFPEKITNREYQIAGAVTVCCGAFCLAGSLGFSPEPDPEPVALIALSAMPVLFGLISLLTKPIRSVLILGPAFLFAFFLTSSVLDLVRHGWRNSFFFESRYSGLAFLCFWSFLIFVRKKVRKDPEADPEAPDPTPPEDQ